MRERSSIDTILVIDDQEPLCRSIQRLLETPRRRIVWALDGKTGFETAIHAAPQVILLDVRMAGMDGLETFQLLHRNPATRDIPVIMMTGCEDADTIMSAIEKGPDQFLLKPVDPARLRKVLDRWLLISRQIATGASADPPEGDVSLTPGALEQSETVCKLELSVCQSQKLESLGRLIGEVAHDFNNLLTVVIGCAEISAAQAGAESGHMGMLQTILDAGNRAQGLARQLLVLSRKESFTPQTVSLSAAIGDSVRLYRRLLSEDIAIDVVPGDRDVIIEADTGQLDQILSNLLVNARDAINAAGPEADRWIRIETGLCRINDASNAACRGLHPGEWATFSVADSGVGMDDATVERIFEPFFTTKASGHGTGLGLSTVYGIVRQNKGGISVCSQPGKGATFTIYWPVAWAAKE